MHLASEQVQRVLHGELEPAAREPVDRHLSECSECAHRVDEAAREERAIFALLERLDVPVPATSAAGLMAGAEAAADSRRGLAARWARRAAGVLLALAAAGGAWALPGSPLEAWVTRAARAIRAPVAERPGQRGGSEAAAPPEAAPAPMTGGIVVSPGERLTIRFAPAQAGGAALVSLTDAADVVVSSSGGHAAFATDAGSLTIGDAGPDARYEIELPRRAPRVEIRLGERHLLLAEHGRVVTDEPTDAPGRWRLRLDGRGLILGSPRPDTVAR